MERVSFLVEETGETVSCLLNPEDVVVQRQAGLRSRRSLGGGLTGRGMRDDPLVYTGGGRTELQLRLLFDVALAPAERAVMDVRELSRPLWELSENQVRADGSAFLPPVRFIWGKSWNIRGVIEAIAEKQDRFASSGIPLRSWIRLRFVRVDDPQPAEHETELAHSSHVTFLESETDWEGRAFRDFADFIEVLSEGKPLYDAVESEETGSGPESELLSPERPDTLADRLGLHVADWRLPFIHSGIDDPYHVQVGAILRLNRGEAE